MPTRTPHRTLVDRVSVLFVFTSLLIVCASRADAATRTWTGTSSGLWNVAANWGGTLPVAGDDLVFPAGAANTTNSNNFVTGTLFHSITFEAAYSVLGNPITLGDGGLTLSPGSTNNVTVLFAPFITLSAAQTWTALDKSCSLGLTGNIHLNGHLLSFNTGGSPFASITLNGVIDGSGGLTKDGTGDVIVNGNNTYSGITTIDNGRLLVGHANALGVADGTAANGTLINFIDLSHSGILAFGAVAVGNEAVTINGFGYGGNGAFQTVGGGSASLAGPITVASGTVFNVYNGPLTLAGPISGPGRLVFPNGQTTLTNGSNSYTGGTFFTFSGSNSTAMLVVGADNTIPGAPALEFLSANTLVINGHAQTLHAVYGAGTLTLTTVSSMLTLQDTATDDPWIFSGTINGLGLIDHTGTGHQVFSGTSSYLGNVAVHHGTVTVATGVLPSNIFMYSDGRFELSAGGTTAMINANSGIVALSDTSATPLTGNSKTLTMSSAATFEIAATTAGSGSMSKLSVTGTVTLGNAALSLVMAHGVVVPVGSTFTIIDNDGSDAVSGTFAGLPEGATVTSTNGATFRISYVGGTGNDVTLTALSNPPRDYLLSEGATGSFFTTDILLANPNTAAVPIHITFLKDDGTMVPMDLTLAAGSHQLIRMNTISGMESTAFSTIVRSLDGSPLVVERTMSWDKTGYGAHSEHATDGAATTWYFAEGSQGFFHTYLLLSNPQSTANSATVQYLLEGNPPVTRVYPLAPTSRLTVDAGTEPSLLNQSFGMIVTFAQPGAAERAMYFGDVPLFSGGHESAGVNAPSNTWFLAEGATGPFFETFLLLANPGNTDANVTLTYLPLAGSPVSKNKTVPAHTRVTVDIEGEDPSLSNAAVSTQVQSSQPILVERSQYWPDPAPNWYEAHNSFGVTALGTKWGLAEGRVGNVDGVANAQTYILLANPGLTPANVTITFLRDDGTTNVTKHFVVEHTSRYNVQVGAQVPELTNEHFGALVTSDQPIAVERALYWDANGQTWTAGTNATATPLP
jgi:autotransporter-associated beta strand protein